MLGNLSGPTLIVILFIVLLLFGAPKLPGLAKSLGQSMRILKKEVSSDKDADKANADADGSANNNASNNNAVNNNPANNNAVNNNPANNNAVNNSNVTPENPTNTAENKTDN